MQARTEKPFFKHFQFLQNFIPELAQYSNRSYDYYGET